MIDYIRRQATIDIIQSYKTNTTRMKDDYMQVDDVVDMLDDMMDDVENIFSADVKPVERGNYTKYKTVMTEENCYTTVEAPWNTVFCDQCWNIINRTNFCPNCGTDMRGEIDGK